MYNRHKKLEENDINNEQISPQFPPRTQRARLGFIAY